MSNNFKKDTENNVNNLQEKADYILNKSNDRINKLNNKIFKIRKVLSEKKNTVKNDETLTDAERNKLQIEIKDITRKCNEMKNSRDSIHNINTQKQIN